MCSHYSDASAIADTGVSATTTTQMMQAVQAKTVLGLRLVLRHLHSHLEICEARENARARKREISYCLRLRLRKVTFTFVFIALASATPLVFASLVRTETIPVPAQFQTAYLRNSRFLTMYVFYISPFN